MEFIDTHTHIFAKEFKDDFNDVVHKALQNNINKMLLPNIDAATIPLMHKALQSSKNCYGMMGLHPCSVNANFKVELAQIEAELKNNKYIAVGEIGLDYHWDLTFKAEQIEAFRTQLNWAKKLDLPVAIHTRDSFDDAIKIVEEEQDGNLRGVFHCFGGTVEEGLRICEVGFYYGIGGVVTFKNSNLKTVLPSLPMNRMLLETDAPYLAPVPYRGKRNEPAYILNIAKFIASELGIKLELLAEQTTQNAVSLFKL